MDAPAAVDGAVAPTTVAPEDEAPIVPGAAEPSWSLEDAPQFLPLLTEEAKERRLQLVVQGGPLVKLLVGDAIGDAFGLGIEMEDARWIRANVAFPPSKWPESPLVWGAAPMTRRGMYSDDCEMTVGLMKAFTSRGREVGSAGLLDSWKEEWELAGRRREGHGSIRKFWEGKVNLEDVRTLQAGKVDPGNAPPMRSLPLLVFEDQELVKMCAANADATHPHPKARAASFLIAIAARWLVVQQGDKSKVIRHALEQLQQSCLREPATAELLASLEELPDWHSYGERFASMPDDVHMLLCGPLPNPNLTHMKTGNPPGSVYGISSDAMRTAGIVLYILKWHRGPLDALAAAVDVGGDVDSTAALVLGIVGGSHGLAVGEEGGLPAFLVWELEGLEYLVRQAGAFQAWLEGQGLWQLG